jgi:hypothetical protein
MLKRSKGAFNFLLLLLLPILAPELLTTVLTGQSGQSGQSITTALHRSRYSFLFRFILDFIF